MDEAKTVFSYDSLPADVTTNVLGAMERIRLRMKRTAEDIIEIGHELLAVKGALPHGQFVEWLQAEFKMSLSTAQNFMNVYKRFGKSTKIVDFNPSVIYELSAPSTPNEVVKKAMEIANTGDTVTAADVKQWKDEIKQLKKQHREKQANLKTEVATLQLDLKNRADRNTELTKKLQEYRENMTKTAGNESGENVEEWQRRVVAAEKKERQVAEELLAIRQERNNLRNHIQALESRNEAVVGAEPLSLLEYVPVLPKETLFALLSEIESAIRPIGAILHIQELKHIHSRLFKTVTAVENAMGDADYSPIERSEQS
ncbi:MAG: DUF3102 domain-containing protein [Magnetococcales bacterium]|nr:DUF3102 domain-containing protein [Magnetococcales bacterium]